MPLFSVTGLNFSYDGKPVLRDISLTIESGSTWAIIGKNGAGKSSLIKCLGRLVRAAPGKIIADGRELNSFSPRELASVISYVPQASGRSVPPFSVEDYVMMGRFPYQGLMAIPASGDREIVRESLELTDTLELAQRDMPSLSGGELQRVFLAGAVAQRSRVMLLDEPVAFLDPLHQELVRRALSRIHEQYNTTMITVTHDINAALSRYENVLSLVDGRAHFAGSVAEFRARCPEALSEVFSITFESAITCGSERSILVPGVLQ